MFEVRESGSERREELEGAWPADWPAYWSGAPGRGLGPKPKQVKDQILLKMGSHVVGCH